MDESVDLRIEESKVGGILSGTNHFDWKACMGFNRDIQLL